MSTMDRRIGGEPGDEIQICFYEDWMLPQIIDLFVREYGFEAEQEKRSFLRFYEHTFQKNREIRLVAVDGDRVCGFQSLFYWPYVLKGKRLNTLQSGRSLVSPDYRGRRIFARLLNFLHETPERPSVDFLVGFPVQMSYGSFMRNNWSNPLDLSWYARVIHPFSVLRGFQPEPEDFRLDREAEYVDHVYPDDCLSLSKDADFADWRRFVRSEQAAAQYYYFHHSENGETIRFELKPNRRGRVMELIVGDIATSSRDPKLLDCGVKALVKATGHHRFITVLTIAINRECRDRSLLRALKRSYFIRLRPKIHFIVKPVEDASISQQASSWWLLRGDIDTW